MIKNTENITNHYTRFLLRLTLQKPVSSTVMWLTTNNQKLYFITEILRKVIRNNFQDFQLRNKNDKKDKDDSTTLLSF